MIKVLLNINNNQYYTKNKNIQNIRYKYKLYNSAIPLCIYRDFEKIQNSNNAHNN